MAIEKNGKTYDFGAWATCFGVKCTDGRTICHNAFDEFDGATVPMMWDHHHEDPEYVVGKALLEKRGTKGLYMYGSFNNSPRAERAKEAVRHGDIDSVSIYANHLEQDAQRNVSRGRLIEVSLVLAGANPGAKIDFGMAHSDEDDDSVAAQIFMGDDLSKIELEHADKEEKPMPENSEMSIGDWLDSLDEQSTNCVNVLIGTAYTEGYEKGKAEAGAAPADQTAAQHDEKNESEDTTMTNVFEQGNTTETVLSHSDLETLRSDILADVRDGKATLKDAIAHHCAELDDKLAHSAEYGIDNIEYLFPDFKDVKKEPDLLAREDGWVAGFIAATSKTPFSRIRTKQIDIRNMRAKGYETKGATKVPDVAAAMKRTTEPTFIYAMEKLDRQDIVDITDFDVVALMWKVLDRILKEELAVASLVGDGRDSSDPYYIDPTHVRPIWTDDDLYTIKFPITTEDEDERVVDFIDAGILSRKTYKGSGNPTLYTTEDILNSCLILKDAQGYRMYKTVDELAKAMRVKDIITVRQLEGIERESGADTYELMGLIFNPTDYTFGSTKGGEITRFSDFDIDKNQEKYLLETRLCGALTVPYSAIAIEYKHTTEVEAEG